jgi:hypothetical protein
MPEGKRISLSSGIIFYNMATTLNFLVINTYSTLTLGVADTSTYASGPTGANMVVTLPTGTKTLSGATTVTVPFTPNDYNVFNSATLQLSAVGADLISLPDGIYGLTYYIATPTATPVSKSIMRTDKIQEKFDSAFMKLDMMECDMAIKTQQKVTLSSIYFLIQGSIAAANNSATTQAAKLYQQANMMLDNFIKNNCGCSGNNYIVNFT